MADIRYTFEETLEPGNLTVKIDTEGGKPAYLHSKMYPSKEQSSCARFFSDNTASILIILGTGLGYHLPEFFSSTVTTVILIDILPLKSSECTRVNTLKAKHPKISFYNLFGINIDDIRHRLESAVIIDKTTKISIIEHPASVRLFPEYYKQIQSFIDAILRSKIGNLSTINSFSSLFIRNCIKKIPLLDKYIPFSALSNSFKNQTCLILSSAPSTDAFMESISAYRDRFIIICIDSAYSIAKVRGITPDFIFSSDPQPWTEEHLLNADTDIPLITALSSHEPKQPFRRKFLYLNSHPFSQIIEQLSGETITADSKTGTVAGDALYAAFRMGFSNVFITGTDFSFPGHCIYSKDSFYNLRYSGIFNSRIKPCETLHEAYIRRSPRNSLRNGIRTRSSFLQFHDKISTLIGTEKSAKVYHLCNSGIPLDNAEIVETSEIAENLFSKLSTLINTKLLISQMKGFSTNLLKNTLETLFNKETFMEILRESFSADFTAEKGEKMLMLLKQRNR
jgi:hypothetical protein